jgi:drug/metabolite transporter (DMT)-like permease
VAAVALALGASLVWGVSDFTGGLVSRRHALLKTLAFSQVVGVVFVALLVAARGEPVLPAGDAGFAALGGLSGLVGIAGLYRGMAVGAMSVVAPLSATAAVVPALVGLATGEHLGGVRYGGIVLALAGIVLASREPGASARLVAGAAPAMLAIGGFGGFFLAIDRASAHTFWWAVFVARATSAAVVAALALATRIRLEAPARDLARFALVGVCDTGANVLFAAATTHGLVSVVSVLVSLYPLVVVALAHLVLGERIARSQQLGAAAALAGAALVSSG